MTRPKTSPRRLTDRTALLRNRTTRVHQDAMFLFDAAQLELLERLKDVNRTFTKVAILTGQPQMWQQEMPDAEIIEDTPTLNFQHSDYDLVIHAMGLHWADDPVGQLIQSARALRPDGLFLGSLFGGQTLHQLRQVLAQAETDTTGGLSPRIAPMAEIRDLGALLQRAGLALPVADNIRTDVAYRDIIHLMRDLRHMGEGNALADRIKHPTTRGLIDAAQSLYQQHFPAENSRILATFETVFLTGWAPAESQQKPLRPGSATHRLADALGQDKSNSNTPKD